MSTTDQSPHTAPTSPLPAHEAWGSIRRTLTSVQSLLRSELAELNPEGITAAAYRNHLAEVESALVVATALPPHPEVPGVGDGMLHSLDVSTAHLKPQHLALLTERKHEVDTLLMGLLIPIYTARGSIWWIGNEHDHPELAGNILAAGSDFHYLLPIVALARAKGCAYVWFDGDGVDHDGLASFDHAPCLSQTPA